VALLAAENATLEAGWNDALGDLERSRGRLVRAADEERRKVERDLHDGIQQHLIGIMIGLALVSAATRRRSPAAAPARLTGRTQVRTSFGGLSAGAGSSILADAGGEARNDRQRVKPAAQSCGLLRF
jgi:signal transduction histidine kinase